MTFKHHLWHLLPFSILGLLLVACSPSVEMPKGTSEGYTSARMVNVAPDTRLSADEKQVHQMIQNSIRDEFKSQGMPFGSKSSDLIVAYLVIYQEPGMTAQYDAYFGYGRDADSIRHAAHMEGAVKNKRPDYFKQAGVLVDVLDARSNELIYRGHAAGDLVKGLSSAERQRRVRRGVSQALAGFFN